MKHLLTLALFVCLGTFASAQIPSYVPTNGLVGWWPFNGNANDESGNGNHGTVNGATLAADRFGNAGKAYSFNGVSNITKANFSFRNGDYSVSFWFKVRDTSFNQRLVTHDWQNGGTFTSAFLKYGNNLSLISGQHNRDDGSITGNFVKKHSFNCINNWILFTVVTNGNLITLYLNDQLADSTFCNIPIGSTNTLFFGGDYPFNPFNGLLDDIAIYNRALSPAEVQQLYLGNCTQPTFTAQPQNKSVAQGQTTTFVVQVDTTATFQWQMNLGLGAGWVNIPQSSLFSGDTTATLSVQGRSTIDGAQFRCIATSCQSDTSNAATLTVTSNASTLGSVAGVPGKINYQGAAVDSAGKPMKNQTIALKLSVLDSSSTGAAAYVETHSTPTNGSGLFSLQIGGGTAVTGTFDSIPWANGRNKYLKTEVNQNGTWVNLGTSQLVSVPYALHAGSAKRASELMDSAGNAYQIKIVNGQPTLVAAPITPSPGSFACGQSVTYAGESYPTVQIGTQCWFQKNVNVGTMVQGANDQTNNGILEKYCYNNDTANCSIYGGLYQWAEAVQYQNGASNTTSPSPAFSGNVQGICPTGWHVPSDGEYCTLSMFLDSSGNCGAFRSNFSGGALKDTSNLWLQPNIGATNRSGFSALPGGAFAFHIKWYSAQTVGCYFFTCSENSNSIAKGAFLVHNLSWFESTNPPKMNGFSLRCLKD